jgi:hypothetical protein
MRFVRRLFLLAGMAAALATIIASTTTLLTWLYPPSQSKELNQPTQPGTQPTPVVIVQTPAPVVIIQAPEPTHSNPNTYYRPSREITSSTVESKETPVEPQPKVDIRVNAHSNVAPNPPLSATSLALLNAAALGSHDRVKQGLAYGADPNAAQSDGKTPLMFAAANGHHDICKTLVQAGAVLTKTDLRGRTVLHYAAEGGHNDLVQFLLKRGALAEIVDVEGWTALDLAVQAGHDTCARVIRDTVTSRIR